VRFLLEHGFATPKKLLQPSIVNRFEYYGVADEIIAQQKSLLTSLLSNRRFHQLMDAEVAAPDQAYPAMDFLHEVQDGIWSELRSGPVTIDVCRRSLQRTYLEHLKNEMKPKEAAAARPAIPGGGSSATDSDFRAVARAALEDLALRLDEATDRASNPTTRVHMRDCRREVERILNPKD
jgi:hypothetical protein